MLLLLIPRPLGFFPIKNSSKDKGGGRGRKREAREIGRRKGEGKEGGERRRMKGKEGREEENEREGKMEEEEREGGRWKETNGREGK